ncbi:hypothetical protein ARMGADRAFT_1088698 [Armillaria gallica]|uniref:Mid2 domain-containing protein n=1 Tax=Armillaria gallica TaxID=47427 RepID=A0A2H3D5A2_ARMGA|nr:hypothetical protein ARMGADRAFT_1088698 [Armillaria gallica]
MTSLPKILFGLSFLVPYLFAQDHTQCVDSGSDWYTSVAGETPCRTYERLRQICNSNYVLGALNPNTPPDTCNDQVADCCCNSIAFGLSMLCLTCQHGIGPNGNGIDAGIGAYQLYLKHGSNSFCTPNTNKSFTNDIQTAVCNNGLKIHDNFYDAIFWADGPWFYTWSREQMEKTNAADGNNPFTHCTSAAVIVTTINVNVTVHNAFPIDVNLTSTVDIAFPPTSLPQSTSISQSNITSLTDSTAASATSAVTLTQAESSSKSLSAGAIARIVVGSIAFVWAITLSLVWLIRRRQRQAAIEHSETSARPFTAYTPVSRNPEGRLREKEQRELPPVYTE